MTISLRAVGAKGDGVTNDTLAIESWLQIASNTGAKAYAESGTYLHDGFVIPRDVTVEGESRTHTTFLRANTPTNPYNILFDGPQIYLRNLRLDGNELDIDGIVTTSNGSYFSGINDINIHQCKGVALDIKLMHNGYIKNCSFNRCGTAIKIHTSVGLTLDTIDFGRPDRQGILFSGSPNPMHVTGTSFYCEAASSPSSVEEVNMIHLLSLRNNHVIDLNGLYVSGHDDGQPINMINIDNPISMHNVKISKVLALNVTNGLVSTNATNEKSNLKLADISYEGTSLPIPPQDGITLNQ